MRSGWLWIPLLLAMGLAGCTGAQSDNDALTFSDDFTAPGNWRISSDPEVEIGYAEGGLVIEVKVIDRVAWSVAGLELADGVVSVDATPVGGPDDNAFGLVIRHVDDRNFYRFEISSDGFYAIQAPKGSMGWEFLVDWTESQEIRRGRETNRLRVECQGTTLAFYVNDVKLATVDDDRYSAGDVGLIAGTFYTEPGTHILFDNFAIVPISD